MMNRENIFEHIEAYLAGELTEAEKTAFEKEIAADNELAEEVALQKDTHKILEVFAQNTYKEKLRDIDAKIESEGKVKPLWQRMAQSRIYSIAAVILILIASAYVWQAIRLDTGRIADQAFQPYMNIVNVKGDNPNIDDLLQSGVSAYQDGNYAQAIEDLTKVLAESPDNSMAAFYLGTALVANGQPKESIQYLEKAKTSSLFSFVTDWYLGLAHLKAGNIDQAEAIFQTIANDPDSDKQNEAKEIMGKLNSFWRNLPGIG